MTGWQLGHAKIANLITQGYLDRVSGEAANGAYLLTQASQRLLSARAILDVDPIGAFELAYDSVRNTAAGLLNHQGLRIKSAGGHAATADAVRAQFGPDFDFFNTMRRVRNKLEYPRHPDDLLITAEEVQQAIDYAETTLTAATELLPQLGLWS